MHSQEIEFAQWKAQRIKECIPEYNNSGITILDVGCADATGTYYLQEVFYNANVIGVDTDTQVIAHARELYPDVDARSYTPSTLPFVDQSVDCIILSLVVHHLSDAAVETMLKECARVLTASGVIVVLEFNPYNIFAQYNKRVDLFERDAVLRTPQQVISCGRAIFSKKTSMYYYPSFPLWAERLCSSLPFGTIFTLVAQKK